MSQLTHYYGYLMIKANDASSHIKRSHVQGENRIKTPYMLSTASSNYGPFIEHFMICEDR